ncbi:MAG: GntR family transcriptional regulator [Lautropia sp.]
MSTPLTPLDPAPGLADRCYEMLLGAIVDGELDARRHHTQESLARRLGVSRQPVMHALQRLRREGLMVGEANGRGLRVAPINAAFVQNLYQVREALDALAATAAAVTPRPELREPGQALIRAGRQAAARREPAGLAAALEAEFAFHAFVYRASHNPLLIDAVRVHWHHSRRIVSSLALGAAPHGAAGAPAQPAMLASQMLRRGWSGHQSLLAAIVKGEVRTADRLAREHAREAAQATLAMLFDGARRS